jgi:hypothetical protein
MDLRAAIGLPHDTATVPAVLPESDAHSALVGAVDRQQ